MSSTRPLCASSAREPALPVFARTCLHLKPNLGLPRNLEGPDPFRIVCGAEPPFPGAQAGSRNHTSYVNFGGIDILPVRWELDKLRMSDAGRLADGRTAGVSATLLSKNSDRQAVILGYRL
jgi:hypothetical protein